MRQRPEAVPTRAIPARPFLDCAAVGLTVSLGDPFGQRDSRALLVQIPETWRLAGVEDRSFENDVETISLGDRNPEGIPGGRYLRLAVDPLLDPWGRVMVGLNFDTPDGRRHAELSVQTKEDNPPAKAISIGEKPLGTRLTAKTVLELGGKAKILFVDGGQGDVLDLSGDRRGNWAQGDTDGVHTLFLRSTRTGKRGILLAVRNGVAVKLRPN
jgi:hypothetical protein